MCRKGQGIANLWKLMHTVMKGGLTQRAKGCAGSWFTKQSHNRSPYIHLPLWGDVLCPHVRPPQSTAVTCKAAMHMHLLCTAHMYGL